MRHRLAPLREECDNLRLITLKQDDLDRKMRFLVEIAPHPLPNGNYFRMVCDSSQPDCFAHNLHGSLSEKRNSQQRLPDELAQNVGGGRHDSTCVRIAEETFDAQML